MKLEICANSFQSAKNAFNAGAHRIELCSELSVGGITPSHGLLKKVSEAIPIEKFVLIRPRSGNFNYSEEEFEIMKSDIQFCKSLNYSGIVSGVLTQNNELDVSRTQELIELSKPLDFTFHRAFDCLPDPVVALEQLISLGVQRILTSGQETTAVKGLSLLKRLNDKALGRIIILSGGGINANNVSQFSKAGFMEVHASASKSIENAVESELFHVNQTESDIDIIKAILNSIQNEG